MYIYIYIQTHRLSPKHWTQNRTSYNAAIIHESMSRECRTICFLRKLQSLMMLQKPKKLTHETNQMACIKIETNRQEHLPVHTQKQGVTSGSWSPTTSHCERTSSSHPPAPRRRTKSLQLHIRQWRKVCLWRSRLPALAPLLTSTFPSKQKRPLFYPCHSNLQE